ncbi:alkaline ceramidase family protein [Coniochaeta ligniaria NRRL 30616]|uniref:Alkaline ceramidase family protein n=1 Tax=Coniochaeta ligniaria NRRL 30616 TaxID=1408157 RepID=A0A1J7J645_9PEZI|nr:alkaline ceramidase family protein [Coniochaeta ligniaria NRRL 30616]
MAHQARHFAGDTHADAGVWSPSTSTANFCEEDYATTIYIAEFVNTISNLAYVYLALRHTKWRLGRLDQLSASLLLVGVCSLLYHATLRQSAQFSDDVSMLFLAGALLQRLYSTNQPPRTARTITAATYASVAAMSAVYVRSGNLLVHLSMFVGMLALVGLRTGWLIYQLAGSAEEKARYVRRFGGVCAYLALAFLLWNVDFEWCYELRSLRNAVGPPWAWLLELHGWWHVLTALGAALHMELVRELCP